MRAACGIACALVASASLVAQTVRTIVSNGSTANRYDVVILGDGYRDVEQGRFDQDCMTFAQALFNKDPYLTFGRYFNVHTVFRASRESGADEPDANPPIVRDTVYDASYNTGGTPRCLYIRNTAQAMADAALAPANEGRILVLVNSSRYGGCGGTFAVSYNGTSMTEVQIHEMGHSVGGLADEYFTTGTTYSGPEPNEANATTNAAGSKWSHWIGSNGIGVFQGCRYYERSIYRPWDNCLLRNLGRPHCSVCAEQLVLRTNQAASAIDLPLPAAARVRVSRPATQAFSFTNIAPPSATTAIDWKIDGVVVASGTTAHTVATAGLTPGDHVVRLEVRVSTALVRRDPGRLLDAAHQWVLEVVDTNLPDLTVESLTPSSTALVAGGTVDLSTAVRNVGNLAAGRFRVEHLLSSDAAIGRGDLTLGGYDLGALAASGRDVRGRQAVQLPTFLTPGTWWLGVVVDYDGAVPELDEGNNTIAVPVQVAAPGCAPVLEYRDVWVYPRDAGTVSLSNPVPFLQPTLTAACNAGQPFAMLWGCSGTSPGVPFGAHHLPLNPDACTLLSMSGAGAFASFWGVLDNRGVGRSIFYLPPGTGLPGPIDTWLAAVLWDGGSLVPLGASNAIDLRITP